MGLFMRARMPGAKRLLGFAVLLVLIAAVWFIGTPAGRKGPEFKEERGAAVRPDLTIQRFHYTERENGERKWEVRAERAERFLGSGLVHMDDVDMEFVLRNGGWVRLEAQAGDYLENEKRVDLRGDIRMETDTGHRLYANRLVWLMAGNLIRSDEPVRLLSGPYTVSGDRMTFDTDQRQMELIGGVRTVIAPDPKGRAGAP